MLTTLAVMLLTQAPQPVKVAVPGLSLAGVDVALGEAYVERFATMLGRSPGLKVTTRRDIEQVLGLERQRQLLGCTDSSSSCLAELAGGLGVDAVLSGTLAKTGSSYTVTMRVIRASDGAQVASTSERLKDEDALSEWLEAEAPRLAQQIQLAFGRTATSAGSSSHPERWVPGIIGAGLLVAGGGLTIAARVKAGNLADGTVPVAEISGTASQGHAMETTGAILLGVGAAGVATSVLWVVLAPADTPQVALVPFKDGAVLSVSGVLP